MTDVSHNFCPLQSTVEDWCTAGLALHWLVPREKRPIEKDWSEATVYSAEQLVATYRRGNNIGVRLGEPSQIALGSGEIWYLHVLDMDIRIADLKDETWDALRTLFPDVATDDLPCVQSGSGGESRHLYLITDKPFRSKRLAVSEGKHRNAKGGWSYDWEIELFGTGKQVAMPPSIHPDTGKPYIWLRPFEVALLDLDMGPFIPSAAIERLAVAEHTTYEFESRDPLTFTSGQLERILGAIEVSDLHYDDWIRLGQALHHQFGGSQKGFDLWLEHTKRSTKFTGDKQVREMRRVKWKSFGRYRGAPVTMASIVGWAQDARIAELRASFDDDDDDADDVTPSAMLADGKMAAPCSSNSGDGRVANLVASSAPEIDPFDAIGTDDSPLDEGVSASSFDGLLGGDDDAEEEDDIDAIGANRPIKGQLRGVAGDWISQFDIGEKGEIRGTLHNIELIVTNDPRLQGLAQLNEFTQETVQRTPPGRRPNNRRNAAKQARQLEGRVWAVRDTLNGELWSDDRDFAIRSIVEAPGTQGGYGIKVSDRDLKAAIVLAANGSAFHPVREYLEGLVWDGTPRAENLFHDYVGAPDDAYSRSVSRLMLVAAVTRIFEPGHKFDFAVILEGLQGKRKSTFIQTLGKNWFGELNADWTDSKQLIELMQGKWIMEIPELSGFNRGDVRSIKAFISTQKDRARLAYARRAGEFPRQCIFIGSTNDKEYLKDDTGGRRFWPMLCSAAEINIAGLEQNVDQIWAEALAIYRAMRVAQPHGILPLYLTDPEAAEMAARLQESRRQESADDGLSGQIAEWLSQPVVSGSMDDDFDADGAPRYRNKTCLMDIWYDCLGNTGKYMTADGNMLARVMTRIPGWTSDGTQHRFPKYGKQRLYYRIEAGKRGYVS